MFYFKLGRVPSRFEMVAMSPVRLHHVPIELVPHEFALLLIKTPADFPSPAQDDLEEPIDLSAWLVQHPAATYIMRVDGNSMTGAGILHDDVVVVNRAKSREPVPSSWRSSTVTVH